MCRKDSMRQLLSSCPFVLRPLEMQADLGGPSRTRGVLLSLSWFGACGWVHFSKRPGQWSWPFPSSRGLFDAMI